MERTFAAPAILIAVIIAGALRYALTIPAFPQHLHVPTAHVSPAREKIAPPVRPIAFVREDKLVRPALVWLRVVMAYVNPV